LPEITVSSDCEKKGVEVRYSSQHESADLPIIGAPFASDGGYAGSEAFFSATVLKNAFSGHPTHAPNSEFSPSGSRRPSATSIRLPCYRKTRAQAAFFEALQMVHDLSQLRRFR
jgi:hypothetical protein